jgi:hypothetical protein
MRTMVVVKKLWAVAKLVTTVMVKERKCMAREEDEERGEEDEGRVTSLEESQASEQQRLLMRTTTMQQQRSRRRGLPLNFLLLRLLLQGTLQILRKLQGLGSWRSHDAVLHILLTSRPTTREETAGLLLLLPPTEEGRSGEQMLLYVFSHPFLPHPPLP